MQYSGSGFIIWYSDTFGSSTSRVELSRFIFLSTCRYHSRHNETVLCPRCQRDDRFRRNKLRQTPYCSPCKIVAQAASFHSSYTGSLELISWGEYSSLKISNIYCKYRFIFNNIFTSLKWFLSILTFLTKDPDFRALCWSGSTSQVLLNGTYMIVKINKLDNLLFNHECTDC